MKTTKEKLALIRYYARKPTTAICAAGHGLRIKHGHLVCSVCRMEKKK